MKRLLSLLLILFAFAPAAMAAGFGGLWQATAPAGDTPFTPVHTYFMSATGSDANSGTDAAHPWATTNHNVVCGDVIILASGSYVNKLDSPGTVSNCPSTTGGIDGAGGVYFAVVLCGGADLEACQVSGTGSNGIVANQSNNWAYEGLKVNGANTTRAFMAVAPNQTTIIHHFAYINNIAYNTTQGFGMNDCLGGTCNHNVPGNGIDYWAVVGSIAANANTDTQCLAAIDAVGVSNSDSNSGTHILIDGNFLWNNPGGCTTIDGEAILLDTLDAHGYTGQVIVRRNASWTARRYGLQLFYQKYNTSSPVVKVYNNTFYGNLRATQTDSADGEVNLAGSTAGTLGSANAPWIVSITKNIAKTNGATSPTGGNPIFAAVYGGQLWSSLTIGGTGSENVFFGSAASCPGTCGASGNSVVAFNGNGIGTDIWADPTFADTSDLITNRNGTPNCTGFQNVTQCMGYDAYTSTLTTSTPIADLTPSGTYSTKGYQRPTTTCSTDPDYPAWLKGIVYLVVSGPSIVQRHGLITTPCGY